jgi:Eco47II restriction endonuclease
MIKVVFYTQAAHKDFYNMSKLSFVSDSELEKAVVYLLQIAREAKINASKDINRNVIDPFSLLFQMSGFGISADEWETAEMNRQAEKTLQNQIGTFHQNILGGVKGWTNLGTGQIIDLASAKNNIIAEVKNKYNTISGKDLAGLYKKLDEQVMPKNSKYKSYIAYYVNIIPKKSARFNKEFTPSDNSTGGRCAINPLIRQVDGASFYEMVTGQKDALEQLFDTLPDVIESVCMDTNNYTFSDRDFAKSFFNKAFS